MVPTFEFCRFRIGRRAISFRWCSQPSSVVPHSGVLSDTGTAGNVRLDFGDAAHSAHYPFDRRIVYIVADKKKTVERVVAKSARITPRGQRVRAPVRPEFLFELDVVLISSVRRTTGPFRRNPRVGRRIRIHAALKRRHHQHDTFVAYSFYRWVYRRTVFRTGTKKCLSRTEREGTVNLPLFA